MAGRGAVRIGCSGWSYDAWRGDLYPEGLPAARRLAAYAERFDTVEVNATFHRLPTRTAVEQWVRETPDGFRFAVKASRYLTHVRPRAAPRARPGGARGRSSFAIPAGARPRRAAGLAVRPSPASWSYVRLHYGRRGRDGNYGPKELDEWAREIDARARRGSNVLVCCNNDWRGFAHRNARGLMQRLGIEPYRDCDRPGFG